MFYKKLTLVILFLLIFSITVLGCGIIRKKDDVTPTEEDIPELEDEDTEEDDNTRETILFYQDDAGYLVPVMRKIQWEEGIAKATLQQLMDTPEQQQALLEMGLKPLLPANTVINGISINDGLAKVDLNAVAMDYPDAISENNMVKGVVMTLVEFPAIDRVQFLFDGKIVDTLKYGTHVGDPIEPGGINLELSPDSQENGAEVTVFFHNTSSSRYDYLVPITRITSNPSATLETALEELLKGPKLGSNLRLDIPENTKILGIQLDNGITYVNLSKEFEALKDSEHEAMVLKAIGLTAMQFPEVTNLKILVEGVEYKGNSPLVTPAFANEY